MKVATRTMQFGALVSALALPASGCGGRVESLSGPSDTSGTSGTSGTSDARSVAGAPSSVAGSGPVSGGELANGGSVSGGELANGGSVSGGGLANGGSAATTVTATGSAGNANIQVAGGAFGIGGGSTVPVAVDPTVRAGGVLTVLSTAPRFPVSLATYDGNVYFVDFGTFSHDAAVYGVDEHGAQLFRVDGLQGAGGIAANVAGVYWAAVSNLAHANLDGSNISLLASTFVNDPIALGPNGVYGTGSSAGTGGIVGVGLSGGPTQLLAQGGISSYGLAADADNVYWTTFSDPMSIESAPIAGGSTSEPPDGSDNSMALTPKLLATSPGPGGAIAIDARSVYWVSKGAVLKVPLGGGARTQLATAPPPGFISGIAVDGTNVYWSTADGIMKVSVDGGTPQVLATGQDTPSAVALDDTSVYWANVGNPTGNHGTISRLTPK